MRSLSLSSAFDLTQGEISRHRPKTLLARNNTFPRARNAPPPSNVSSRHRGAKDRPTPSRPKRAIDLRSALTTTVADRCSTPITELYQAIGKICGDGCSSESTSRGREHTAVLAKSAVPSSLPLDIPRGMRARRSSCALEAASKFNAVIYKTGPKSRQVGSTSTPRPHRERGVEPLNTSHLATSGDKRVVPPPCRDSQRPKQAKRAPQTRRGDELVFLCHMPATTDTLSQRSQPDPRSPLSERPQATLPTHPCCSLARRDLKGNEN